MTDKDRRSHYEFQEAPLLSGPDGEVRIGNSVATGGPVLLHRVPTPGVTDALVDRVNSLVRGFTNLQHPRIPILADMWFYYSAVDLVFIQLPEPTISVKGSRVELANIEWRRLVPESLDIMAAMHKAAVVHGRLRAESFVWRPDQRVLMLADTGLPRRLREVARETEGDFRLQLASNLQMRDVADWANAILSILVGDTLLPPDDDEWDDASIQSAQQRIAAVLRLDRLRLDYFVRCLKGRSYEGGAFGSADVALTSWFDIEAGRVLS